MHGFPQVHDVFSLRLEHGVTTPLTGVRGRYRFIIGERDPLLPRFTSDRPWWEVDVLERIRDDLFLARMLRQLEAPERRTVRWAAVIRKEDRHLGDETPAHLKLALETIDEEVNVPLDFEDVRGYLGLYQGLALRVLRNDPLFPELQLGQTYRLTVKASGSRALYCSVTGLGIRVPTGCLRTAAEAGVEEVIPCTFKGPDERGPFGKYQNFVVRPDRKWPGEVTMGKEIKVRVVGVLSRTIDLLFVLPEHQG